jgi:protein-S-isoprenylcysteine O-methyltransferase Ste14
MGSSEAALRRAGRLASQAGLVALFAAFAYANFQHWRSTGRPSGLGTTALEGWAAFLFLVRRTPTDVSMSSLAWIAAPIGSFAMLLARPSPAGVKLVGEPLQVVGLLVALVSLCALGRSFGVVAANRGVRTIGAYRFVRHPIYAGYALADVGYVLENPRVTNVVLAVVVLAFQVARIRAEEECLDEDAAYRRYREQVRFRLVPRVW